jgi:hypothetical protein
MHSYPLIKLSKKNITTTDGFMLKNKVFSYLNSANLAMLTESYELKLARLNSELLLKTKAYYNALKDGKRFEEVKILYLEIKQFEKQLQELSEDQKPS